MAEAVGGTHFDWWQNLSLLLMPPWAWLLARDWSGFTWPDDSRAWRAAMFGWWGLLVLTGYLMYFPWILDRIKFTQGLVAHSHLAMAGFTTSFCALLAVLLTGRRIGSAVTVILWHGAVVVMIATLGDDGMARRRRALVDGDEVRTGASWDWCCEANAERSMLSVSVVWLVKWKTTMNKIQFLKFWSVAVGSMDAVTGLLLIFSRRWCLGIVGHRTRRRRMRWCFSVGWESSSAEWA